ncbi:trypsin-like peptidase domain-containing protein [Corynebacterium sp. NPDC060344]|uniref:trypsin-like peptidase domain-containing protein n=1 Tax=Corynebacterium sp. NPDC060344 TaxID=3347101 RepID=UPI003646A50E
MSGKQRALARRWGTRVAVAACAAVASAGLGMVPATAAPDARAAEEVVSSVVKHDYALEYSALELAMEPHAVAEDPVSKILGATSGPVHKRVDGVWFSSPTAPPEADRLAEQGKALVGPGTPILVGDGGARNACTLTAAGRDAAGNLIGMTAGHCGGPGAPVRSMDATEAGVIGTVQRVDASFDYAVLVLNGKAVPTSTYGDTRVASVGQLPKAGEMACKQGVATGRTCGPTWLQGAPGSAAEPHVSTQICAAPGDSGAPVFVGDRLVAMVKGSNSAPACVTPWQGPVFAPTIVTSVQAQIDDMNLHGGPGGGFRLA